MLSKLTTQIALRKAGLGGVKIPDPFAASESKSTKGAQDSEGGGLSNPFANVKWGPPKAFASWTTPPPTQNSVQPAPIAGDRAQSGVKLRLPAVDGRPCVVLFLRYCGCPFTEKLFLHLRSLANRHTSIHFIVVSHCTQAATNEWVKKLGGPWMLDIIVDESRELYALWGLGISNWGHLLNPRNGYNQYMLGKKEGVWGQQVGEGGCRWQTGGAYAIDGRGIVKWAYPMKSVDDQVPIEEGIKELGFSR
ncbi:hypothetical protein BU25DRAFT_358614 [Macroventuria anomochaeta]|uniref:Uncharacterized protein n=1 Tax=Macroventuria anomochaeta TaxID=301207 RepID=A0ACB6SCN3_9PLEO|nr:uncharacterized protein BU25DRAFT_358614 [Macroventuria anomochaeta]KAF2632055.1 hypothetical protein BU25DRAFT_358614 [Macroventuria anomochaeta]